MVGILLSYWGGLFSGATLVSGRVDVWNRVDLHTSPHFRSDRSERQRDTPKTQLLWSCEPCRSWRKNGWRISWRNSLQTQLRSVKNIHWSLSMTVMWTVGVKDEEVDMHVEKMTSNLPNSSWTEVTRNDMKYDHQEVQDFFHGDLFDILLESHWRQDDIRFALCLVESRAITTTAVSGAFVPILDHFRSLTLNQCINESIRRLTPQKKHVSKPWKYGMFKVFFRFRWYWVHHIIEKGYKGEHDFPWNAGENSENLGNDSSGDPAILVGDDGLESGPMVAVAFSACMVAVGISRPDEWSMQRGWDGSGWLIFLFLQIFEASLMAILPCLTIPY